MNFRPKHEDIGDASGTLPMTSMIDVVFLLLVFFLVTSTFSVSEDRLSAAAKSQRVGTGASDLTPQIVDVMARDGVVVFAMGELATPDARELRRALASLPKEPGVAIRVHDDATVAAAAAALQAARDAGFEKRSYVPADAR
ncbi:MAG: biopolymer transporter ExbD [Phycisphaerales bacterium]